MNCTHCGFPLTGGTALWNNEADRDPFCSDDCMTAEQTLRDLAEIRVRP